MIKTEEYLQMTKEFGTPLYVYDAEKISLQYQRLKEGFKSIQNLEIHYAAKANTNLNILKYLRSLGSGLDAVSIQEVQLGLLAGFQPKEIMYTPNGVSIAELSKAKDLGVLINIDNIEILEEFGQKYPDYPICVRINPHIMAGGNQKISVGHIDSKFGISVYQIPLVKRIIENTGQKIEGLHMHTGSDILDIDVFLSGAEILFDIAKDLNHLEYLDFGSGFKVAYKEGDYETDINYLGERLGERFNKFCKNYGKELKLIFEPGKFLVSEAGAFLAQVNVIKQTTSTVFASVDSGFNHLIRPMMYDAYHHIENIFNPTGRDKYYTVVGYICETDTFGSNRKIKEIRTHDVLKFNNAGAYCFSMASNYNSRYKPAEVLWMDGEAKLIRERQTMQDLIKNTVEIDF